jgi:hypothetical protein
MKPQHYAEVGALIFAAEATFAVVHRLTGGEYAGFVHLHNVIVDVGLATIWLIAATAMMVRRTFPLLFAVVLGAFASLVHGVQFSIASPGMWFGFPFMLAAGVLMAMLRKSMPAWKTQPMTERLGTRGERRHPSLPSHA